MSIPRNVIWRMQKRNIESDHLFEIAKKLIYT